MEIYSQDRADALWQVGPDDSLAYELFKGKKMRRAVEFTGLVTSSGDDDPVEFPVAGVFYVRRSKTNQALSVNVTSMWATEASRFPGIRADERKMHFKDGACWLILKEPLRVDLWELVVTAEEFVRVSDKYELPFDKVAKQEQIDDRERENLLRTIGVLVRMVVEPKPQDFKTKSTGEFNPSAVVNAIIFHADVNGIDKAGLGRRTLENKLKAAFGLVPKPKGE